MSGSPPVIFRITYARYGELHDDVTKQMAEGGLVVKVNDVRGLTLDSPIRLELVLPDGTMMAGPAEVLQVFAGFGVAVSVDDGLVQRAKRATRGTDAPGAGPARHERVMPGAPVEARPQPQRNTPTTIPPPEPSPRGHTPTTPPRGHTPTTPPPGSQPRGHTPTIPPPGSQPRGHTPTTIPPPEPQPTRLIARSKPPTFAPPEPPVDQRPGRNTAPPPFDALPRSSAYPGLPARPRAESPPDAFDLDPFGPADPFAPLDPLDLDPFDLDPFGLDPFGPDPLGSPDPFPRSSTRTGPPGSLQASGAQASDPLLRAVPYTTLTSAQDLDTTPEAPALRTSVPSLVPPEGYSVPPGAPPAHRITTPPSSPRIPEAPPPESFARPSAPPMPPPRVRTNTAPPPVPPPRPRNSTAQPPPVPQDRPLQPGVPTPLPPPGPDAARRDSPRNSGSSWSAPPPSEPGAARLTPASMPSQPSATSSASSRTTAPGERDDTEVNPPPSPIKLDKLSRAEKIQLALHGTRDQRNAILRDRDRTLHAFVLKNPQLSAEDVVTIAKNAQMIPEILKQIGERRDWFQRPAIALALARNPRTPPELAVRALEFVPQDALRQMAKGVGVLPHLTQAARKKLLG